MSKDDHYFQFPIGVLRLGKSIEDVTRAEMQLRIQEIISWCCVDRGIWLEQSDKYDVAAMAEKYADEHNLKRHKDDARVMAGAKLLHVVYRAIDSNSENKRFASLQSLSSQFGSKVVRLRSDLLWSAHGQEDWTWRMFATLCAVYAGIGARHVSRLSYDQIGAMALGYNGQTERDANKAGKHQLTSRKTQCTVDVLSTMDERSLFSKACPNGRHLHYTNSMSMDELISKLAGKPQKRIASSDITRSIQQLRQAIADAAKIESDNRNKVLNTLKVVGK